MTFWSEVNLGAQKDLSDARPRGSPTRWRFFSWKISWPNLIWLCEVPCRGWLFLAEPTRGSHQSLGDSTSVWFKKTHTGDFLHFAADIRGYNGITPPISLGYVNRLRWISTIFFSGVPFQVVWIPIQFHLVVCLKFGACFQLSTFKLGKVWWTEVCLAETRASKNQFKKMDRHFMTWSMSESSFFEHAQKNCLYIYKSHLSMSCYFVLQSPHFFGSYGWQPGFFRSARLSALLGRARRRWDLAAGSFHFIFISFHFFIIPSPLFSLASQWRW